MTVKSTIEPRLLDRRAAAKFLGGVCERTVKNLVRRGELAEVRIAGRALYDLKDLNELVARNKTTVTAGEGSNVR